VSDYIIQGDQKSLCTWWLQYRKLNVMFKVSPASLQGQGDTRLTLTPSVIPNSNYVIMVSDWNCLKYFCVFLYCNHKVHRDFLITLYIPHYIVINTAGMPHLRKVMDNETSDTLTTACTGSKTWPWLRPVERMTSFWTSRLWITSMSAENALLTSVKIAKPCKGILPLMVRR
jgi:hypothetical protein